MLSKKQILFDVAKLAEKFELEYKEILANYENDIDTDTWNTLYDLGGKVSEAMEAIESYIAKNIKD